MTDESQTQQGQSEKSEGMVEKLVDAAKATSERIGDMVEDVAEKLEDVVEEVAERIGLKDDDDDDDNDTDDDAKSDVSSAAPAADNTEATAAAPAEAEAASEPEATTAAPVETTSAAAAVAEAETSAAPAAEAETSAAPAAEAEAPEAPAAEAEASAAPAAETADSEEGAVFEPTQDDDTTVPRRLNDLEPGMELEGRVTSTALYGVFVDIGVGRDGLVHISEMSDQRIESPTDLVQIGDTVKVRVKSVDPEARRISLTMRSKGDGERRRRGPRRPEIDHDRLGELNPGDLVDGTVNGIAPFGVFVDIGVGKDGLVHISELSDSRVERPEDAVQVGESHTFRVLEVDAEGQRISLSLRRAQEGYQERSRSRRREVNLDAIAPGMILDGTVSGIAPFGAFVDLGVGRDGLVHISELSEGRVGKVEDVVTVGDQVKVRVLEVDPGSKRISLSMRLEVPVGPVSTSGSSRLDRDWTNPALRGEERSDDRQPRKGRRGDRQDRPAREPEVYTFGAEEEEEDYSGNATLDDLLSKYSPEYAEPGRSSRRTRRYERDEEEEDDGESRESRARRDAIRRTLRDHEEY